MTEIGSLRNETAAAPPGSLSGIVELAKHTVVYGLGSVAQSLVAFLLLPLYTRRLSAEEFGILSLITLMGTLSGSVFFLGGSSALARFYFDPDRDVQRRIVVGSAVTITLAGAGLQLALVPLIATWASVKLFGTPNQAFALGLAIAGSALTSIANLLLVILRFEKRSIAVAVVNLLSVALTATVIIWLVAILKMGVLGAVIGTVVGQLATLAMLGVLTRRSVHLVIAVDELKNQLAFGLPAVMIGVTYYALDTADRFLLARLGTLADVGVYSLGYRIGMLIQVLFVLPFGQIWAPMRMQHGVTENARELFRLVLTYYVAIGMLIIGAITVATPDLLPRFAGRTEYQGAANVVPFVLLGHLAYGLFNIVDYGVYRAKKTKYYIYLFGLTLALNVALNYAWIPRFGYMGAAYATLACYLVAAGAMGFLSNRFHPIDVEWRRVLFAVISVLTLILALRLIRPAGMWTSLSVKLAIGILILPIWYVWLLSDRERGPIRRLLPSRKSANALD